MATIAERNEARRIRLSNLPVYLPVERQTYIVPAFTQANPIDELLRKIYRQSKSKAFKLRIIRDNRIIDEAQFNYTRRKIEYDKFRKLFVDYDGTNIQEKDIIEVRFARELNPAYLAQKYREGVKHCVIEPLDKLWSIPTISETMKRTQKRMLKRINEYRLLYGNEGIPETDFQQIADHLNTSIIIRDAFGDNEKVFTTKNPNKSIIFENRSINHLEQVPSVKAERIITHQEAIRIIAYEDNIVWQGFISDPIRIITPTEILNVENPLIPYFQEMRDLMPNVELNATKNPDVNQFIQTATIINSAPLQLSNNISTGHLDLKFAYTQFHKTIYYKGLAGKLQQKRTFNHWHIDVIRKHTGFYQVRVMKSTPFSEMFGLTTDTYILPSPEIIFWADNGVIFHTISGVLCSTFDFKFPDSTLNKVKNRKGVEVKPYQIFSGCLSALKDEHDTKDFNVKGNTEFGQHIACTHNKVYYSEDKVVIDNIDHIIPVITVQKPRKTVYTTHHVLSFITSYIRIIMLTEMMKFKPNQLIQVTLDGIFYNGKLPTLIPELVQKPGILANTTTAWYTPNNTTYNFPPPSIYKSTALLGAGGTGKTHQALSDNGFIDLIYISPTHELGKEKEETYNIKYRTFHKQAGIKCTAAPSPSVAFVDEATQLEGSAIQKLIDDNPHTLFMIAGDIDEHGNHYQTKYQNQIWKPTLPIKWFTKDYRAKTPLLKNMKLEYRLKMKEHNQQNLSSKEANKSMKAWVKQTYPNLIITPYQAQHLQGTRIAGTHKYIDKLNEQFNIEKCKKCDPHYCTDCSIVHTTHAVQGMTIKNTLIIYLDDMFEHTMAYTAMSRAESHEQLYFVSQN